MKTHILILILMMVWGGLGHQAWAETEDSKKNDLQKSVVGLRTQVPSTARTAKFLGGEREGTGVVIDGEGMVVTIGYLMLEAQAAEIVDVDGRILPASIIGYDASSGFGLVQALVPLNAKPLELGNSASLNKRDTAWVASRSGMDKPTVTEVFIADRDTFAGYWEYLLDDAIFIVPAVSDFAGAALVDSSGKLVGVGSLFLREFLQTEGLQIPGNMFVPINELKPIMADLVKHGRPSVPPRPWLGVNVSEQYGRVIVNRVTPQSPANKAGIEVGDIILGVNGKQIDTLETLFRTIWGTGEAGVPFQLTVLQRNNVNELKVISDDRYKHYQFTHLH